MKKIKFSVSFTYSEASDSELLERLELIYDELLGLLSPIEKYPSKVIIQPGTWVINKYSLRPVMGVQYVMSVSKNELAGLRGKITENFNELKKSLNNNLMQKIDIHFSVVEANE